MWNDSPIIKQLDGTFIVVHNGNPYQVCSKDVDPLNLYNIKDISLFWSILDDSDPRKKVETPSVLPSLEEVQALKLSELSAAYNAFDAVGSAMTSFGFPVQIGHEHCSKLDGVVRFAEISGLEEIYITDANDVTHYNISMSDAKQIVKEQISAALYAHSRKQALRALINAVDTVGAIESIVISFS